jgi:hypothetical protein
MSFPFRTLDRALAAEQRRGIRQFCVRVLEFSDDLGVFPRKPAGLPTATPFVSVYARGVLRGCYGSNEGLARAALGALNDTRFGSIQPKERAELALDVTYLAPPRIVELRNFEREIALGDDGVSFTRKEGTTLFLPSVARDEALDAPGLLAALSRKAGVPITPRNGQLHLFSARSLVVRRTEEAATRASSTDEAAAWLTRRVAPNGAVEFGCDPRWRTHHAEGPFLHARSAIVVAALRAHGGHPRVCRRASSWLEAELRRGCSGKRVRMFPSRTAELAGTLALAQIAGIDTKAELNALAGERAVAEDIWHAAQVAFVLGHDTPRALWKACVTDLERHPFAPWTTLAARSLGDGKTLARAERALVDALRDSPPHVGAANVRAIPELALTAIAVEALTPSRDRRSRSAVERGRAFLFAHQLRAGSVPAAFDPKLAAGAFPVSVVVPALRSDVTAHALLALLGN